MAAQGHQVRPCLRKRRQERNVDNTWSWTFQCPWWYDFGQGDSVVERGQRNPLSWGLCGWTPLRASDCSQHCVSALGSFYFFLTSSGNWLEDRESPVRSLYNGITHREPQTQDSWVPEKQTRPIHREGKWSKRRIRAPQRTDFLGKPPHKEPIVLWKQTAAFVCVVFWY